MDIKYHQKYHYCLPSLLYSIYNQHYNLLHYQHKNLPHKNDVKFHTNNGKMYVIITTAGYAKIQSIINTLQILVLGDLFCFSSILDLAVDDIYIEHYIFFKFFSLHLYCMMHIGSANC